VLGAQLELYLEEALRIRDTMKKAGKLTWIKRQLDGVFDHNKREGASVSQTG